MSNERSNLPQQWQCANCEMTIENSSSNPILFCPFCNAPQSQGYTWEQAGLADQAIAGRTPYTPYAPQANEQNNCHDCGMELLPDTEGCVGCGARKAAAGGYQYINPMMATPYFPPTSEFGATPHQQDQQQYMHQMSEQQMQILQQPGMHQMFLQWLMYQQQPQQEQHAKQYETANTAQSKQTAQGSTQHTVTIRCECGAVFNPGARVCAVCGKPPPRNQPTGPPCVHCGQRLIKPDATKCAACSRKQPDKPVSKLPETPEPAASGASLPPGSFQQQSLPLFPTSLPPRVSIISSPHGPQSQYNFPQVFGTPFPLYWPRFPMSSPQSTNQLQPQQGGHQLHYAQSGIEPISWPIQEQTPCVNVAETLPGVPSTARPSKGTSGDEMIISSSKDGHNSSGNLTSSDLLTAPQAPPENSVPIESSQDHTQESVNKNNQHGNQITDQMSDNKWVSPGTTKVEGDKQVTTMSTTTTASSTTVTTTASVSRTVRVTTTVASSPPIQSYAGAVKVGVHF